jgi:spore maturation protein CgeB
MGSHNMRSFEIPATGSFQLSTRSEGLTDWFREDHEVACFDGPAELQDKITYYLTREDERESIAWDGHRRVIESRHSYVDRMEELLNKVERIIQK